MKKLLRSRKKHQAGMPKAKIKEFYMKKLNVMLLLLSCAQLGSIYCMTSKEFWDWRQRNQALSVEQIRVPADQMPEGVVVPSKKGLEFMCKYDWHNVKSLPDKDLKQYIYRSILPDGSIQYKRNFYEPIENLPYKADANVSQVATFTYKKVPGDIGVYEAYVTKETDELSAEDFTRMFETTAENKRQPLDATKAKELFTELEAQFDEARIKGDKIQ
jgi:hypothetical protein